LTIRFVLYALCFLPFVGFSQNFAGRIVRVIEGDALLFETGDSTFEVHMYGIDAPDKGQVFSEETIEYMELYLWHEAEINLKKNINQEGISVILFIDGKNINNDLVKNGYAWYDKLHAVDAELAYSEMYARNKKNGLWMNDDPTPPWEFRAGILPRPPPPDDENKVLICTDERYNVYHRKYCRELSKCSCNVIVILRKQAKELKMKPCKHCY
jgi:micrococcal nuclease